jgi:hypothetical protein
MSLTASQSRAVERVRRVCQAHDDARALRLALLDEIRRVVDFGAYAWLLTDPETEVGLLAVGGRPLPPRAAEPDPAQVPHIGEPLDAIAQAGGPPATLLHTTNPNRAWSGGSSSRTTT